MHTARTLVCSVGIVGALLIAVSACGSSGSKKSSTQSATSAASSSGASGSGSASGSSSASASTSPAPSSSTAKPRTKLSGTCDTLLPQPEIEALIGVQFAGKSAYVVGIPEKNIGRIGYLNCRYGLGAKGKNPPSVEIGVSLYKTSAQAGRRLTGTVADYRDHGATQSSTTVSGQDATVLSGGSTGYDVPTLVIATDQRTVAVSVAPALLTAAKREPAMVKMAALALDRTAP